MCFCIFPVFIADDGNIPKRSTTINMINTAVLVLKFLINLRLKQLGDIPNLIYIDIRLYPGYLNAELICYMVCQLKL